jgi:hypothetical protein
MIHVFFVPGMFGSTIEYVLRTFSQEYDSIDGAILPDGSMHSYGKELHICQEDMLSDLKKIQHNSITTPIYPFKTLHLPEILDYHDLYLGENSRSILMYANDLRSAELNILFQHHKISVGKRMGLEIFCYNNSHNIVHWNTAYKHWKEMQPWEQREWFSLFYAEWIQEWIQSQNQVPNDFLKIINTDLLYDTEPTLIKIINHCGLTLDGDLSSFVTKWQRAQQYIVDEFDLLDQIVDSAINQQEFSWQPTHLIAEAIVQQRLRAHGYEIRCDGLNTFPTDSKTLYNLLEKC